jgi:hypothetical protein
MTIAFWQRHSSFRRPISPNVRRRWPLRFGALRHPSLLVVALTSLLYNFGFFTMLA